MAKQILISRQKIELQDQLKELNPDISTGDREAYEKKAEISRATLSRYLNGTVNDIDRAVDMIVFFRNRIAKRNEKLDESKNALNASN